MKITFIQDMNEIFHIQEFRLNSEKHEINANALIKKSKIKPYRLSLFGNYLESFILKMLQLLL